MLQITFIVYSLQSVKDICGIGLLLGLIVQVLGHPGTRRSLVKKGWILPALFCWRDFNFDRDRVAGFVVKGTLFLQDMRDLHASHLATRPKRL